MWIFFETISVRNLNLADLTAFWKTERDSLKMSYDTCNLSLCHLRFARLQFCQSKQSESLNQFADFFVEHSIIKGAMLLTMLKEVLLKNLKYVSASGLSEDRFVIDNASVAL